LYLKNTENTENTENAKFGVFVFNITEKSTFENIPERVTIFSEQIIHSVMFVVGNKMNF
jgi:hypothetical protein